MYVTEKRPPAQRFWIFFIGEVLGFIAAFLFWRKIVKAYKFVTSENPTTYLSISKVIENSDTFLKTTTKSTYIGSSSSSSSSSHSSSHSSSSGRSGGGSHGGGGHHR